MKRKLNITVMLGGPSAEREVSLRTGAAVAAALRSLGHEVSELDPRTPDWILPPKTDVVFLALHGTYGEDGTVQRQLDFLSVPYTGCDAESSRIAFDKILSKQKFIKAGVPTAKYAVLNSATAPLPNGFSLPLVVKPARQGSSVGLQFVERPQDWPAALAGALKFDSEVIVEEKIVGRETTVGILGSKILPVVEVRPKAGSYDYQNKYTAGNTEYFCPADFDAATTRRIQDAAFGAFAAVGGRDYARVDVMVREVGQASSLPGSKTGTLEMKSRQARCLPHYEPVVLEVNTLPGMTATSLLPKAAAAAGLDYAGLCQKMVELALARKAAALLKAEEAMAGSTVVMTSLHAL